MRWRSRARIGRRCGRIDVGRRNQVGPQQMGQLLGVDPVVLVLAAVDVLQVQRMGQHELDARLEAGIRQPVPVERAFADHRQVVAVRLRPASGSTRSRCP